MSRNNLYKLGLIVAITAFSLFSAYPPGERINLGLDLRGGIHLVLDVVVDEAVAGQVRTDMERLQELLQDGDVTPSAASLDSGTSFSLEFDTDLQRDGAELVAIEYYDLSYDVSVSSGPPTLTLTMKVAESERIKDGAVRQSVQTIRNRIDQFGVAEPVIQRQGMAGTRILVQLPGVEDPERVKSLLRTSAILQFRLVQAGPAETREALLVAAGGTLPPGTEIVESIPETSNGVDVPPVFWLLDIIPIVEGGELKDARLSQDQLGLPAIGFTLEATSAQKFGEFTAANIGRYLAIVLDDRVQQAPSIEGRIDSDGIIRGQFTLEEAEDKALMLRSGALPASIEYLEDRSVGPSLGRDSIRQGVLAAMIGMALVVVFMLIYYRGAGINAVAALALNLIIVMGVMASLGAALTLPGIAGLILLIGMSVDANVLIFERIREELDLGKTVRSSIDMGFARAFSAILDANLTTLIAAVFLFQFGTGPVKGFAVTITIGIVASMFTALFVSRVIFAMWTTTRRETLSMMRLFGMTAIDFLSKRGIAAVISGAVILASIASIVLHGGLRYGIDFAGGSQVIVLFAERPDLDLLRDTLAAEGIEDAVIQEFVAQPGREEVLIRTPMTVEEDAGLLNEIHAALNVFDPPQAGASRELDLNTVSREVVSGRLLEENFLEFDTLVDIDSARAEYDRIADLALDARDQVGLLFSWDSIDATGIDPRILSWMKETFYFGTHAVVGQDSVGPQVGADLRRQTAYAMFWALLGLLAYISYRFEFRFGVGAVAALVHDVTIAVGAFSIAGREFNLPVVAAFLTIIGYSLNDTVVVFDRIRENGLTQRRMPLADRINLSINQTLSRTMLTSGTTLIVVLALFFYGGPVINNFAFALLVGVIVGTYSSVFVASPVYHELTKRAVSKKQ